MTGFNALGNIFQLSDARTRLITAENVYGEKGRGGMADNTVEPQPEVQKIGQHWDGPNSCARELGQSWKVRPCVTLPAGSVTTLMDADGPGIIQHIWITLTQERYRDQIIRIYWDGEETPSVEAPVGDLFCCGFNDRTKVMALPINVNPSGGFNSYFPMPFRKHCKILDGVNGKGHYVGTYMAWQQNNSGWWGEGEIKFFLDGDTDFPTLCGTGTEDYFGGAWGFGDTFTAPFLGYPYGDPTNRVGARHGLYRFHIMDPIRFQSDLRVTMQAIGWRSEGRYLPLQDDISSVAYWYQTEPHTRFPELGDRNALEVI